MSRGCGEVPSRSVGSRYPTGNGRQVALVVQKGNFRAHSIAGESTYPPHVSPNRRTMRGIPPERRLEFPVIFLPSAGQGSTEDKAIRPRDRAMAVTRSPPPSSRNGCICGCRGLQSNQGLGASRAVEWHLGIRLRGERIHQPRVCRLVGYHLVGW